MRFYTKPYPFYGGSDLHARTMYVCAQEGLPFVLGHARYMLAIHGGKAKHDTIDAQTIALLLRGGMLP
jgi:hypothetical protein